MNLFCFQTRRAKFSGELVSTIHRVHVISSQDYHRIYLNKNLQLQMSCDYFSDYMRGFQWCHNRGSSLLSDLRQSSYKLQPFILIKTSRKIALFLPCSSIGRFKALQIWSDSLEFGDGASQPLLYLALTTPCFYEEKQMCFPVSTKQSRSTLLYTEC